MNGYRKLVSLYHNASIKVKLMVGYIGVSLFLVVLIGFIANYFFSAAIEESASESTLQAIRQANSTVDSYIQNAENVMTVLANNRQVLNTLGSSNPEQAENADLLRVSTGNYLASIVDGFPYFRGIALIGNDGKIISNEMYPSLTAPLTQEDWYIKSAANPKTVIIDPMPIDRNLTYYNPVSADEIISMTMSIPDPSTGSVLGVILIDLDINILGETLKNTKVGKNGFIFIVDQAGESIYTPLNKVVYRIKPEWLTKNDTGIIDKLISGEDYQLIYSKSVYTGWKTVGVFSLNETLQQVANFRYILMVVLIIAMLLVSMFSIMFSTGLTKPLRKLRGLMKQAEHGDFTVHFDTLYLDDVGQLGNSFNAMIDEIRHLVELIYRQQQQKRSAELTTLQSLIKPHFLYNTFDTIHWMAKRQGAKDIEQIISALTKLYRIGLSKGNEVITVGEEIEHVRNYLIIQSIRYMDILEYEIDCPKEITGLYVQKLILQPIVENAIYHGIKNRTEPGKIILRAFIEDEKLIFEITDDGPGISKKRLDEIMNQIQSEDNQDIGYGLYNVNKRIVLMHGKEYGVSIKSVEGAGTTVTIRYPLIYTRRDIDDV